MKKDLKEYVSPYLEVTSIALEGSLAENINI